MYLEKRQSDRDVSLYFIAIIPHANLRDQIKGIKERMQTEYGSGHALKSPAHITLQIPFKRSSAEEARLAEALRRFAADEQSFSLELNGYGAFAPRVIFIKIVEPDPVARLHSHLKKVLIEELHFNHDEVMNAIQPHITVATRDLTKEAFNEAWPEFQNQAFRASFEVKSIFLLKHNGRHWDILEEFPFGRQE
jgi:2'-5' RNA ligase